MQQLIISLGLNLIKHHMYHSNITIMVLLHIPECLETTNNNEMLTL